MFSKIRKLETELASLREQYAERTKELKSFREKEFLKCLSHIFQIPFSTFRFETEESWEIIFNDLKIRFYPRAESIYISYNGNYIMHCAKLGPVELYRGVNISLPVFVNWIGPLMGMICTVNLKKLSEKYLESDYPETLQSVLLILGTQHHSIFSLVGKDITRIICQMALK